MKDGLRGGAARRQHAGDGRFRNREPDPRSSALREDADHLRNRRARHRVRSPEGLSTRRSRLRVHAGGAGDPAQQGRGAGRAALQAPRAAAAQSVSWRDANNASRLANSTLQAEKTRELEELNRTLQSANAQLEATNRVLATKCGAPPRRDRAEGGRPSQGRVPRDARARAAQPAGADRQCRADRAQSPGRAMRRSPGRATSSNGRRCTWHAWSTTCSTSRASRAARSFCGASRWRSRTFIASGTGDVQPADRSSASTISRWIVRRSELHRRRRPRRASPRLLATC